MDAYRDKQYCYSELIVLRKAWSHTSFTVQMAGHAYKTLAAMWIWCPEEIQYIVQATLDELERRCELMGMSEYKQHYNLQETEDVD